MIKSMNLGDLKIEVPVIQGGMGVGISLSGLASAVANMGGVGVISSVAIGLTVNNGSKAYRKNNIEGLRREIRRSRELSSGVIGVNIMSVITDFSDMVRTAVEEGIDIIFSGAGLPLDLPGYLINGSKTKIVPIVSSARAATIISKKWIQNYNYIPDAFVVEGPKAGGHLGFKAEQLGSESNSLESLIADLVQVSNDIEKEYGRSVPIIAAGGIYTGSDIYDMIKLGASAVQMGTRFVATEECDASPEFKDAFIKAREEDIMIIKSPVGMPGRAINNKFLSDMSMGMRRPVSCHFNCIKSCDPKTTPYCIADALVEAYRGNMENGFAFTGSNGWRIDKITTVKDIFEELQREYLVAAMQAGSLKSRLSPVKSASLAS